MTVNLQEFIYTIRGSAKVQLHHEQIEVSHFHLISGGKGHALRLLVTENEFEYYLISYKAMVSLPCRQDIRSLMEQSNGLEQCYVCKPQEPIVLMNLADKLLHEWNRKDLDALRPFHTKTVFHQLSSIM